MTDTLTAHMYTPSLIFEPTQNTPWLCFLHLPDLINNRAALRAAGRAALQRMLPQPIIETKNGPTCTGFSLSVSYATDVCLLGVSYNNNLGIDIVNTTALYNWSPNELNDVAALYFSKIMQKKYSQAKNKIYAFAHHWATFESQAKAHQQGIAQYSTVLANSNKTWIVDGLPIHFIGAATLIKSSS